LGSRAPLQVVGYVPAALELVAVVEHVGRFVNEDALSWFWKPEYAAVIAGGVPPARKEPLDAVTVSGAGLTTPEPGAYVMVYAGSEAPEHVLAPA
jgi:hypothetical protein